MSSIKIKIKRRDSDWNIVQQTQTVELNKDTAFNLQGDGYFLPNFIGKIIKRGEKYILINEEDSANIQEYLVGDGFTTVQDVHRSNFNFWESEESYPEHEAQGTDLDTTGEEKKGPDYNDGGGGLGFLAGGRKKKKRKRRRKKSTKRRLRKKSTKRRLRKKSTKRRLRKKSTKRRRKRRR